MPKPTPFAWIAVLAGLLSLCRPAHAFDPAGHSAIEMHAYALLEARPAQGGLPDGKAILKQLQDDGVLHKGKLEAYSGFPDLSLERQFAQDRQMYHFMAPNWMVVQAARLKGVTMAQRQQRLLALGLTDCLKMLYLFYREMLVAPEQASAVGRGMYILMHAVADSYSHEHAARDEAEGHHLLTIKGWKLSRFGWPAPAKENDRRDTLVSRDYQPLALLHRSSHPEGDFDWAQLGCKLSPAAREASEAIADLLILTYRARRDLAEADALWRGFAVRRFMPAGGRAADGTFIFGHPVRDTVRFAYPQEFARKGKTFEFDLFPQWTVYGFVQGNLNRLTASASYGAEVEWHWIPGFADKAGVLLNRIPYGAAVSATYLPGFGARAEGLHPAGADWQVQALAAPNLVVVPKINALLQPRIGLSLLPFAKDKQAALVLGADLAWIVTPKFRFPGRTRSAVRVAAGYEYDRSGLPAIHSLSLKLGLNTWKGRRVYYGKG